VSPLPARCQVSWWFERTLGITTISYRYSTRPARNVTNSRFVFLLSNYCKIPSSRGLVGSDGDDSQSQFCNSANHQQEEEGGSCYSTDRPKPSKLAALSLSLSPCFSTLPALAALKEERRSFVPCDAAAGITKQSGPFFLKYWCLLLLHEREKSPFRTSLEQSTYRYRTNARLLSRLINVEKV